MYASENFPPVLVTGATGYVAGVLVEHLVAEGYTVHATVRDKGNLKNLQYLHHIREKGPGDIHFFDYAMEPFEKRWVIAGVFPVSQGSGA